MPATTPIAPGEGEISHIVLPAGFLVRAPTCSMAQFSALGRFEWNEFILRTIGHSPSCCLIARSQVAVESGPKDNRAW